MQNVLSVEHEIVKALRGIIRGVDHHSRKLYQAVGLTWPQLATLRAAARLQTCSVTQLAKEMRLGQATLSGIVQRLERSGYIERRPHDTDGRSTAISVTQSGHKILDAAPSLLQDRFRAALADLKDWERTQTLASLQRIAEMMDVDTVDASPILATGPIDPSESDNDGQPFTAQQVKNREPRSPEKRRTRPDVQKN